MAEQTSHLDQIDEGILSQMEPSQAQALQAIVISGKQILYDPKTHGQVMDGLRGIDDQSDPRKVALGVAGLLTLVNKASNKTKLPVELMVPAGALLGVEVLRFLNQGGMLPESPEFTGNMIEELLAALMQKMGMGKQQQGQPGPQEMPQQGMMQDPQAPQGMPPGPPQGQPQAPPQGILARGGMQ